HYMGALVIEPISDREFQIIDGQQRLATLTLLALAVIKRLLALAEQGIEPEANRERAQSLRHRFIGEKDPTSLIESSKLFLNATDDAFFQDYLIQLKEPRNPRGLPKSNQLLWNCFQYFYHRLGEINQGNETGQSLAALLSETVARQLLFILITVDDELNAYTVFETLNARGLELSATDLLKNYLFSRVRVKADLEHLQRRWQHLIATIRQERFPDFLRYHLLCQYSKVRKQRLFKIVRDTVREPEQVFELMDALEGRAELFAALQDETHEYWIENREARPYVRELILFGSKQLTPVLFAAWDRFAPHDFARTTKLISRFVFRYTVVSSLNTNALEPISHEIAKGILNGSIQGPRQVYEKLKPFYVDDEKFKQDFTVLTINTGGRRRKVAKYILCCLEVGQSRRACDPETDPATIEHILPENPSHDWADLFPEEKWDEYIYRLGNLTLLEQVLNREIGNRPYSEKLEGYARSQYRITSVLPEFAPAEWTPQLIERRQWEMAERAAHLWRSDFE
ncbi:DUF1524 domain-containing protein, partial [Alcanivorax sp.]|uniref:DUF262 domain-containing protein n=1 Tax=Alcanivorax sp. TaxID=1872427 RepID=UPI00258DAC1A